MIMKSKEEHRPLKKFRMKVEQNNRNYSTCSCEDGVVVISEVCCCAQSVDFTTKGNLFPGTCTACCNNQGENQRATITRGPPDTHQKKNYSLFRSTMRRIPLWNAILLIWMSLSVGVTEGLQCYECLSLYCDSGAVCDAIKSTMVEIFVPKRHFIHFDPTDICPENELPINSQRWANLSRECERSDSICLVSPIEVHTVVDGKKNGKRLENEYTLMTYGYLRGCASRRKLLEYPETINVRVEFAGRNESGNNKGAAGSSNSNNNYNNNNNNAVSNNIVNNHSNTGSSSSGSRGSMAGNEGINVNGNKKAEIFYNMTNMGNGAEFDPSKKTYKDGYSITKIYSHVFYIDQGAKNATRCYEDNCNDKAKFKFKLSGASGFQMLTMNVAHLLFLGFIPSII